MPTRLITHACNAVLPWVSACHIRASPASTVTQPCRRYVSTHVQGVAIDGDGNVLLSDLDNRCVRLVSAATGHISTLAGGPAAAAAAAAAMGSGAGGGSAGAGGMVATGARRAGGVSDGGSGRAGAPRMGRCRLEPQEFAYWVGIEVGLSCKRSLPILSYYTVSMRAYAG